MEDKNKNISVASSIGINAAGIVIDSIIVFIKFFPVHDAPTVLGQPWTPEKLRLAIKRLKLKKSSDETGLTAELLSAVPEEFLVHTLAAFNVFLESGRMPHTWKLSTFRMLPQKLRAIQTNEFRPIASSRLFHKVFGYLILGRVEEILEAKQPQEQHGLRPGRKLEEHLLTANLLLDKAAAGGIRVWIISLDLSKAFDRVHVTCCLLRSRT